MVRKHKFALFAAAVLALTASGYAASAESGRAKQIDAAYGAAIAKLNKRVDENDAKFAKIDERLGSIERLLSAPKAPVPLEPPAPDEATPERNELETLPVPTIHPNATGCINGACPIRGSASCSTGVCSSRGCGSSGYSSNGSSSCSESSCGKPKKGNKAKGCKSCGNGKCKGR